MIKVTLYTSLVALERSKQTTWPTGRTWSKSGILKMLYVVSIAACKKIAEEKVQEATEVECVVGMLVNEFVIR